MFCKELGEDFGPDGRVESKETVFVVGGGVDFFEGVGDGRRGR